MKRERLGNGVVSFVRWDPIRSKSIWPQLRYHRPIFNLIFSFSELAELQSLIKFARCCQKTFAWENDASLVNALHQKAKSLKKSRFPLCHLRGCVVNLPAACRGILKSIKNFKWLSNDSRSAAFLSPTGTYNDFDFILRWYVLKLPLL